MPKIYLLFYLWLSAGFQNHRFDLKEDLRKDLHILKSEHADYNRAVIENLKAFKTYANTPSAGFEFEKRVNGNHVILKWTKQGKNALCIYEVTSIIAGDTVYHDQVVGWDSVKKKNIIKPGEKIRLKPHDFVFHTYIIKPAAGKQLVYTTAIGEGLYEYWIGNKSFSPLYESIALGIKYPDLPEILRLVQD